MHTILIIGFYYDFPHDLPEHYELLRYRLAERGFTSYIYETDEIGTIEEFRKEVKESDYVSVLKKEGRFVRYENYVLVPEQSAA